MPKRKSAKVGRSKVLYNDTAFQEIEDLLQTLDNKDSSRAASATHADVALALPQPQGEEKADELSVRWADLIGIGERDDSSKPVKRSSPKKQRSRRPSAGNKLAAADDSVQLPTVNQTSRSNRTNNSQIQASTQGNVLQLDVTESTYSDDGDTSAFLAKIQQLATQKKKVCPYRFISRIARFLVSCTNTLTPRTHFFPGTAESNIKSEEAYYYRDAKDGSSDQ